MMCSQWWEMWKAHWMKKNDDNKNEIENMAKQMEENLNNETNEFNDINDEMNNAIENIEEEC